MHSIHRTTQEKRLDFLLGEWLHSGQTHETPFAPEGPISGSTEFYWDVGNKWLLFESRLTLPGVGRYEVHGGIGFNRKSRKYQSFAVNNLGNMLIYDGDWVDDASLVFVLVNPEALGNSRIVYEKMPDGSLQMNSEKKTNGGRFEAYFESTLKKKEMN